MNRPSTVKPDNFFLLLFNALRQRRVPIALRIVSHSLLLVVAALLIYSWVMGMQFRQAMQQQADALGQSLTTQTAASATELLVSNDILSLNVLLGNLVRNPLVAHAAIYSVDNRVLAEAGSRPTQALIGETEGLYSTPITFQEVIAGHLRISLDMQQFQHPMTISLQSMGLLSLILLALTLSLSLRLGRQLTTPLLQLRLWLRDPDDPAPGAGRQDEIGDVARQLQARLVPPRPQPEPAIEDEPEPQFEEMDADLHDDASLDLRKDPDDFAEPDFDDLAFETEPPRRSPSPIEPRHEAHEDDMDGGAFAELIETLSAPQEAAPLAPPAPRPSSAVLAIQLGAQDQLRHLPRARLVDLLQRYRDCLAQSAALYRGKLHTLSDGSSLILFHAAQDAEDYRTHAICCGELMRALGHALQIEVADSGITLQLQLGLAEGDDLSQCGESELLLSDSVLRALALSQHSRNLLLIEAQVGEDPLLRQRARLRRIASPEGACCVERLLDPYPALLERQLTRMHDARGR